MSTLDRITIYPVKSLDGVDVATARVLPAGGLEHDRRWQLVDMEGRVLNAKRSPLLHAIRAEYDLGDLAGSDATAAGGVPRLGANVITLAIDPAAVAARAIPAIERLAGLAADTFPLVPGPDGPCGWLAEAFGQPVLLLERADGGFPDDREAAGPTVISTATLVEVARWFRLDVDECRRRFRANLEVGGCAAFWEDSLASPARPELQPSLGDLSPDLPTDPYADLPPPEPREFAIGDVQFRATNVCRRCVVPSRDSRTGAVTEQFRDVFEAWRGQTLPAKVDASGWSHLYRLGVNTIFQDKAGTVGVGGIITVRSQ
ncbi:MAG: MOSC N-terminal beta barrel domain-containing protein [Planctomycetia bacterium]|nr:MOSC N-terminal beta barrel domain-containing protein [Planctomycetia bacterium]